MPTYEYECAQCGNRFEKFQRITESPLKECPQCHSSVKRVIGAGAGFIFKGNGFYITDYRSQSYKDAAKREKGDTPKKETPAKADTAPPKNTDSKSSS